MSQHSAHRCADCGAPCQGLLCEPCAALCDTLTRSGRYYAYRTGQSRPGETGGDRRGPDAGDSAGTGERRPRRAHAA